MQHSRSKVEAIKPRPLNCADDLTSYPSKKCPYCRQFHLRSGYCQALDPINAERYSGIWDGSIDVDPAHIRGKIDEFPFSEMPSLHRAETGDEDETFLPKPLVNNDLGGNETFSSETFPGDETLSDGKNETFSPKTDESETFSGSTYVLKCITCGKQFRSQRSHARFCSSSCRLKELRRLRKGL